MGTSFPGYSLIALQQTTSIAWVAQSVTGYADDFHASDIVTTYADLVRAEHRIGSLLDVLADAQMRINSKKSAMLLRVCGRFAKRWLQQHRLVKEGCQPSLADWQRLRKILCSRAQLDVHKRIATWKATVSPTMVYGLAATAPGLKDLQRIQHQLTKHLRAITHLYAHLSKVSTSDRHQRFGIATILDILHKEAEQWQIQLTGDDVLLLPPPQVLQPMCLPPLQPAPLCTLQQRKWVELASDNAIQQIVITFSVRFLVSVPTFKLGMTNFTLYYMDLDEEEAKFFGALLDETDDQGQRQKWETATRWDYAGGSEQWETPWSTEAIQPYYKDDRTQDPYQLHMWNLTKLVLQQEQTLASLRQDVTLYLFVKTGQGSIVSLLHQTAEKWRQAKDTSEMEKAKKLNWVDERGHWRVLKWDLQRQELQVDESKITVSTEDLLKQTVEMRKGVTEEALHRFRSYKKMTDQPVTEWMQFRMEISLRPLGDPVWNTLQTWVGQAAWHLLGCRLRRERPQYNGLVEQVRQGM
ncbi:unnamed protein product [Symbiodinium sp. CCMP2592]|nr:unnamed protein product [Symbiodinium sp. CCMP2592]